MFCPECGYKNDDKNKYCIGCGKDIRQEAEAFKKDKPDNMHVDNAYKTESDTPVKVEAKPIKTEPGVCPECGYHNSPSNTKCIRCDFELKPSEAYDNRTFESTSSEQYNDQYINSHETVNTSSVPQNRKEEPDYSIFSSDYKSEYKYKMLKVSLACSIGGAALVIIACFMSFMNIDLSLLRIFSEDIPQNISISFINIKPLGIVIILFMVLLMVLSVLKRQEASNAPLISSVILFCRPLIEIFSDSENDDQNSIFAENIADDMWEFGVGFYLIIIGFVIIGIGICLARKDNWDKTTRTMQYIVSGIMAVIVVAVLWKGYDTDVDNLEGFVDYSESYSCEILLEYNMNEIL